MMSPTNTRRNRQIVLSRRPDGPVDETCFSAIEAEVPAIDDGEVLVKTRYISIDPAIRGWLNAEGSGYLPGVPIGEPVRCAGIGEVVESRNDAYPVGCLVTAMTCWQEYSVATSDPARPFELATRLPPEAEPLDAATVFSHSGWTAYVGVHRILQPQDGTTFLVTSGAGLIGSLAGQMAKKQGAYVVGTVGSEEKRRWCVDELGFDACINYKSEDLDAELKAHFPRGIDAVFDNVGGATLDAILRRIGVGAKVALCGSISTDNGAPGHALRNYDRLMSRRATMTGFNTIDHLDLVGEITENYRAWLDDGSLQYRVNLLDGLDRAPEALLGLYDSSVVGKIVVAVGQDAA